MNTNGPIIIIEDSAQDQLLLEEVFMMIGCTNQRHYFTDGALALKYLSEIDRSPFLILSDVNMPKLNGFALRSKLKTDASLELKCIPYLFFSSAAEQKDVIEAYSLSAQGFFIKQGNIDLLEKTLRVIIDYWKLCESPSNYPEID